MTSCLSTERWVAAVFTLLMTNLSLAAGILRNVRRLARPQRCRFHLRERRGDAAGHMTSPLLNEAMGSTGTPAVSVTTATT